MAWNLYDCLDCAALLAHVAPACTQFVCSAATGLHCRMWVGRVAALAGNKDAAVRKAVTAALYVVYSYMDGPTLLAHIVNAPSAEKVLVYW